eukprot:286289-Rhodomonas_salina.4
MLEELPASLGDLDTLESVLISPPIKSPYTLPLEGSYATARPCPVLGYSATPTRTCLTELVVANNRIAQLQVQLPPYSLQILLQLPPCPPTTSALSFSYFRLGLSSFRPGISSCNSRPIVDKSPYNPRPILLPNPSQHTCLRVF